MFKQTVALGAIAATLCATTTLAQSGLYKSGFLAGVHVGVAKGSGTFNSTFNPRQNLAEQAATEKARKSGTVFGILAGYRHLIQDGFTLGFDIAINVFANNMLEKKLTHNFPILVMPFQNKLTRRQYSIVPNITVGKIFWGQWHAFLGLGLAFTRFKQEIDNLTTIRGTIKSVMATSNKLGFVPSVGLEYAATSNTSLFGNLSYEIYKKINIITDDQLTRPIFPGSSYKSSISPRYFTVKVGAIYRF